LNASGEPLRVQARSWTASWSGALRAPARVPVYIGCVVLSLACNYLLGRDSSWDTLHYHLYAGFAALHDRFSQDYFAAGPGAYFNPYVYVPFYALVSAGFPALLISSILAVLQSTVLWLTYELALCVCPAKEERTRVTFGVLAVALAFLNPILIGQLGSSFADILTCVPVLAGWLLLATAVRAPAMARVIGAGLLLGTATALKLTNSVHALAACAVVAMIPLPSRTLLKHGVAYGGALALSFALVAAPWAERLQKAFGNPFFPLMNGAFRSPDITTGSLVHYRFIPASLGEALWRPFAMLDAAPMVHVEVSAPDLRYAALIVLVAMLTARWLYRQLRRSPGPATQLPAADASARVLAALGCGVGVDWVLWLRASGNSRYFLPMACVAAVILVALLFRALAGHPKLRNYTLLGILGLQTVGVCMGAEYRWSPVAWGGGWFDVEVPAPLASEPNLFLTIGVQSNSFVAPYLARGSGLVNFSGSYPLGAEGANGAHIRALIRRYSPHVRMLITGERLYEADERRAPRRADVDEALARFGLRVDDGDCATITVRGVAPDLEVVVENPSTSGPRRPADAYYLVSCHVVPSDADPSADLAAQRAASLVLDRVEDACPQVFQPPRLYTEHIGPRWQRLYLGTDLRAWISHDEVEFLDMRSDRAVSLGRASDWSKAPLRLACGRRGDRYFANVLDTKQAP
jgi:hypothetical protein